jgi:hypothetical protein
LLWFASADGIGVARPWHQEISNEPRDGVMAVPGLVLYTSQPGSSQRSALPNARTVTVLRIFRPGSATCSAFPGLTRPEDGSESQLGVSGHLGVRPSSRSPSKRCDRIAVARGVRRANGDCNALERGQPSPVRAATRPHNRHKLYKLNNHRLEAGGFDSRLKARLLAQPTRRSLGSRRPLSAPPASGCTP